MRSRAAPDKLSMYILLCLEYLGTEFDVIWNLIQITKKGLCQVVKQGELNVVFSVLK